MHNELSWGDDVSLAVATLTSPPDQTAKGVFITDLKAKYDAIEELNAVWGTQYESWEALLQSQQAPDKAKAREDLEAFYTKTAETYFSTVRRELKKVAPNQLYLGCRFAWVNDRAARAAIKFCDVISYNRYNYGVEDLKLPDNVDMPVIIGEFHFGALDRGMFHTGLRSTDNQQDRADKYTAYVRGACATAISSGPTGSSTRTSRPPAAATARTTRSASSTSAITPTRRSSRLPVASAAICTSTAARTDRDR